MRRLIKGILIAGAGLLGVLALGLLVLVNTGPSLPPGTDKAIDQVMSTPLPELIRGETGIARSGDIGIWYERRTPARPAKGSILLVMGALSGALQWPEWFMQPLLDAGYQVIRYDHRGVGMSDWMADWDKDHPYSLETMADDAVAVLDAAGVDKAHVIGASMGGMIGQRLAISHAGRVLSLTSISSSGYLDDPLRAPRDGALNLAMLRLAVKYGLVRTERNTIKLAIGFTRLMMSGDDTSLAVKAIAEQVLYELRKRRGFNAGAWDQHLGAIRASGSRYDELGAIRVPVLIVHGTADAAIPFSQARHYAGLIPNADTLWLEGVGHVIPERYTDTIVGRILALFDATAAE